MKNTVFLLIIIVINYSCSNKHIGTESISTQWNPQNRTQFLENRNDSSTWDYEMFEMDKQYFVGGDFGPFEMGVFPVTKYEIVGKGTFQGLGNISEDYFQINDKKLVMSSFYVCKNELNKNKLKEKKDKVFFQVLVLTDTLDTVNYNLYRNIAVSRNHPDYFGQGFVKTKKNRIDYFTFQTAENNTFAIINARVFDLKYGKTILIAPQKDGTLRSLQLQSPELTSDEIVNYTEELTKEERVIKFFEKKGNI